MPTSLSFTPPMDFVLSEASGMRSRTAAVVTQSGTAIRSGTVLTQADTGAAVFAMDAGSTGNPTAGTITVGVAALPGVYRIVFTAATLFLVEDPNGVTVDNGTLGTAFSAGGLGFTLTAGGTAAVSGDTAKITVAAGTGKFVPYTADRAAGPAAGILYNELPAATGDVKAVVFDADMEVRRGGLVGLDAAAEADLLALGIKVRGATGALTNSTPAL
jgi:hypothetical protein